MADLDLDAIEACERAATPGPWERGYVWLTAPPEFDADQRHVGPAAGTHCCYCHLGEPLWSGQAEFYGRVTLVHRHRHSDPPRTEKSVSGSNGLIVATEILAPEDTEFIAAARTDVPALVAEVRRLRDDLAEYREANTRMQEINLLRAAERDRLAQQLAAAKTSLGKACDEIAGQDAELGGARIELAAVRAELANAYAEDSL